jgi:hypothetical protein
MNRVLLIAAAWGILVWNILGLLAFASNVDAGAAGVVAGVAVAIAIPLARGMRLRSVARSNTSRGPAEA